MRLKPLKYRKIRDILRNNLFEKFDQTGSHVKFRKEVVKGKPIIVVVPKHPEIAIGLISLIIRQSKKKRDEFTAK